MQSMRNPAAPFPKNPSLLKPWSSFAHAARVQHRPCTAEWQGLLTKHLLGQKMCPWCDFIPQCPTGRGRGADRPQKLLWQPVGRSPPWRRQGPNLTGLQESRELGEPWVGCGSRGCGRGREGRARSLSPAFVLLGCRRAFLPHLLPTAMPWAVVSALPSESSCGRRWEQDRAAAMSRQRGVRLKNEGGNKAW